MQSFTVRNPGLNKEKINILTDILVFRPVKEKFNQEARRQLDDSWICNRNVIKPSNVEKFCRNWGILVELVYNIQMPTVNNSSMEIMHLNINSDCTIIE